MPGVRNKRLIPIHGKVAFVLNSGCVGKTLNDSHVYSEHTKITTTPDRRIAISGNFRVGILRDVITDACPRYLRLARNCHHMGYALFSISWICLYLEIINVAIHCSHNDYKWQGNILILLLSV